VVSEVCFNGNSQPPNSVLTYLALSLSFVRLGRHLAALSFALAADLGHALAALSFALAALSFALAFVGLGGHALLGVALVRE